MDKSKWTDRLPDLMEGYTEAEPEGLWDAVQAGMKPKARRIAAGWWYAAGSLAAAAAVVLAVFLWPVAETSQPFSPVPGDILAGSSELPPAGEQKQPETLTEPVQTPAGEQKQPETLTDPAETPAGEQKQPKTLTEPAETPAGEQKQPETLTETGAEEWFLPDQVPSSRKKGAKVQLSVTSGGLLAQAGTVSRNGYGLPDSPVSKAPAAAPALFKSVNRNKASSTEARHWQNFRAGLLVNYAFSPRWSVETGVEYTSLQARQNTLSGNSNMVADRHFNYLGIPLNVQFRPLEMGQFSLYLSAGPMFEFLVGSRERSQSFANGVLVFEEEPHALDLSDRRWSLNAGLGLQWQPFRFGALFIQPGVSWHLPAGENAPETFYSTRPVAFDLIFGARFLLR